MKMKDTIKNDFLNTMKKNQNKFLKQIRKSAAIQ